MLKAKPRAIAREDIQPHGTRRLAQMLVALDFADSRPPARPPPDQPPATGPGRLALARAGWRRAWRNRPVPDPDAIELDHDEHYFSNDPFGINSFPSHLRLTSSIQS